AQVTGRVSGGPRVATAPSMTRQTSQKGSSLAPDRWRQLPDPAEGRRPVGASVELTPSPRGSFSCEWRATRWSPHHRACAEAGGGRRRSHGRRFVRGGSGWLRCSGRELAYDFLLVRLQLRDIAFHLLLTGRELGCEHVHTLPQRY